MQRASERRGPAPLRFSLRPWHLDGTRAAAYLWQMAEPTNLNRFRKQQAREKKRAQADENAVKFGRTRAEKQRDKAEAERATRSIDGHKRDA